jgi:hypothetical protein
VKEFIILVTQKLSLNSQKYVLGIHDPRSGENLSPDPGVKKHRISDPQHRWEVPFLDNCLIWKIIRRVCSHKKGSAGVPMLESVGRGGNSESLLLSLDTTVVEIRLQRNQRI